MSHVNDGKLTEALEILEYIISSTTGAHRTGAFLTRGTARAMMNDLQGKPAPIWPAQTLTLHSIPYVAEEVLMCILVVHLWQLQLGQTQITDFTLHLGY